MLLDALEEEVTALGAEVTRLRVMLYRVTQYMDGAPCISQPVSPVLPPCMLNELPRPGERRHHNHEYDLQPSPFRGHEMIHPLHASPSRSHSWYRHSNTRYTSSHHNNHNRYHSRRYCDPFFPASMSRRRYAALVRLNAHSPSTHGRRRRRHHSSRDKRRSTAVMSNSTDSTVQSVSSDSDYSATTELSVASGASYSSSSTSSSCSYASHEGTSGSREEQRGKSYPRRPRDRCRSELGKSHPSARHAKRRGRHSPMSSSLGVKSHARSSTRPRSSRRGANSPSLHGRHRSTSRQQPHTHSSTSKHKNKTDSTENDNNNSNNRAHHDNANQDIQARDRAAHAPAQQESKNTSNHASSRGNTTAPLHSSASFLRHDTVHPPAPTPTTEQAAVVPHRLHTIDSSTSTWNTQKSSRESASKQESSSANTQPRPREQSVLGQEGGHDDVREEKHTEISLARAGETTSSTQLPSAIAAGQERMPNHAHATSAESSLTQATARTDTQARSAAADAPAAHAETSSAIRGRASPTAPAVSRVVHGVGAPLTSGEFGPNDTPRISTIYDPETGVYRTLKMPNYQTPVSAALGDKLSSRYGPFRSSQSQDERSLAHASSVHSKQPHEQPSSHRNDAPRKEAEPDDAEPVLPVHQLGDTNEQSMSTFRDLVRPTFRPLQTLHHKYLKNMDLTSGSAKTSDVSDISSSSSSSSSSNNTISNCKHSKKKSNNNKVKHAYKDKEEDDADSESTSSKRAGKDRKHKAAHQQDDSSSNSMYDAATPSHSKAKHEVNRRGRSPSLLTMDRHNLHSAGIGRDETFPSLHGTPHSVTSLHTMLQKEEGGLPSQHYLAEAATTPGVRTPQSAGRPPGMRTRMQQLALEEEEESTNSSDSDEADSNSSTRNKNISLQQHRRDKQRQPTRAHDTEMNAPDEGVFVSPSLPRSVQPATRELVSFSALRYEQKASSSSSSRSSSSSSSSTSGGSGSARSSLHKDGTEHHDHSYTHQQQNNRHNRASRNDSKSHYRSDSSENDTAARRTTAFVTQSRPTSQQQSRAVPQVMNLQAAKDMFDMSLDPHYEAMLQMMSLNAPAMSHDEVSPATNSSRAQGQGQVDEDDGIAGASGTLAERARRLPDKGGSPALSNYAGHAGNSTSPDINHPSFSFRKSLGSSFGAYDYSMMLRATSRSGRSMFANPDDAQSAPASAVFDPS